MPSWRVPDDGPVLEPDARSVRRRPASAAAAARGGGQAMGFAPDEASLPPDVALAYAGVLKAPPPAPFEQRWTAWGAGYGGGNSTSGNLRPSARAI